MKVQVALTVSRGYSVCELEILTGSHFVGIKINEAAFSERDIHVLTLHRGKTVIPNPKVSRVLEPGDRSLCFGKREAMKSMVPIKSRKKRAPKVKTLQQSKIDEASSPSA